MIAEERKKEEEEKRKGGKEMQRAKVSKCVCVYNNKQTVRRKMVLIGAIEVDRANKTELLLLLGNDSDHHYHQSGQIKHTLKRTLKITLDFWLICR